MINDRVFIHYVGTLLDGTKFDSSRDRNKRFEFDLGKGNVINAWDMGVITMKRGEICRLICQPEYAYGEQSFGPYLRPNSTVVFEIELLDFIGQFKTTPKFEDLKVFFLGEDLSEEKDQTILRRVLSKGEESSRPNDGSRVEISLKGIHENQVFDDRTVKFILGEGFLQNIAEGFVIEQSVLSLREKRFLCIDLIHLFFSLECAITRMTKGEYCQIKLKSKATIGLENFQLVKNAQVEYFVTLINFEKVFFSRRQTRRK